MNPSPSMPGFRRIEARSKRARAGSPTSERVRRRGGVPRTAAAIAWAVNAFDVHAAATAET